MSDKPAPNAEPTGGFMSGKTSQGFALMQPSKNKAINPGRNYMQVEVGEPNMWMSNARGQVNAATNKMMQKRVKSPSNVSDPKPVRTFLRIKLTPIDARVICRGAITPSCAPASA